MALLLLENFEPRLRLPSQPHPSSLGCLTSQTWPMPQFWFIETVVPHSEFRSVGCVRGTISFAGSDTAADASAVSTAVVLVYIREDEWDRVVCKVDKSEIPENIRHELEDELAEVSKAMAGPAEGHLYVDVNVITEEDLERASLDLHCLEVMAPDRKVFSYRTHKHESIGDIRRKLCRNLGISQDAHKLWLWSKRQNLMRLSLKAPPESRLLDIKTHRDTSGHPANNKNVLMTIPLYLQEPDLLSRNDESILLFFKFFDPSKGTLEFLGERSIPAHEGVQRR
ncbi:hypothetical protein BSKO_13669 [Bryopsis sp. KO-2023]|nr:hypothetical protein BSKO_13669 [Bryopsis sp. KO-2023]